MKTSFQYRTCYMNKIKIIIISFLCAAVTFASSCIIDLKPKSTELFSDEVLSYFSIPWLTKPEGAIEEVQTKGSSSYEYEAKMLNEEDFNRYLENVFNEFSSRDYTLANYCRHLTVGEAFSYQTYYYLAFSEEKTYKSRVWYGDTYYRLYFTRTPLGGHNDEIGGYEIKDISMMEFVWYSESDENGYHQIDIWIMNLNSIGDLPSYFLDEVPEDGDEWQTNEKA